MTDTPGPSAKSLEYRTPWLTTQAANYLAMSMVLIGLITLFSSLSEHFFALRTFSTIANQIPDLTVIAVGMTFVLLIAGIDLSVGSVMALSGAFLGVALIDWGWPIGCTIPLCIAVGMLCGTANGFVSVWWSIPSFIVTLGMLEIARGGAYLVTDSQTKYIGASVEVIGRPLAGVGLSPAFFVAVVVVLIGQLILSRTVFGRYAMAIGANESAVRYSGINTRPVKVKVFALAGALSGLGGVFHASRLASADPNAGIGLELSAIAAVVIGGTSLMGGRGSVISSFFGVLIIAVLQSGLAQVGASEPTKRVITGSVIVAAVVIDALRSHLADDRQSRWSSFFDRILRRSRF